MKKLAINPSNKKYYSEKYIKGWEDGVKAQYEATKDAVEVVRCKDCKNRARYAVCDFLEEDGFCPHGERRRP